MEIYALFFLALSVALFVYVMFLKLWLRLEQYEREGIQDDYDVLEAKYNHLKCKSDKRKELLGIQDQIVKNLQEEIINLKIK